MSLLISGDLRLAKGQPVPNDPNFAFNSLLLHGNGTNGSTVITDSSGSPKTVTAADNAQISTAQSKFGGASIAFDGNDYLSIGTAAQFPYSTNNFTIESFIYPTTLTGSNQSIYSQRNAGSNGMSFRVNNSKLDFFVDNGDTGLTIGSTTLSVNTWYHVALTREGNTFKIWLNGNNDATSATLTQSLTSLQIPFIGTNPSSISAGFIGYIDEFRITMGIARYTANFTPPTAPFPDF